MPATLERTEQAGRGRATARAIAILVVGLIVFATLEVLVRVAVLPEWRDLARTPFEHHAIYRTFQKPNLAIRRYNPKNYDVVNRTNSLGFRDREAGFESDLSGLWVSGMSNSFAGGVNDQEVYAHRLQAEYGYANALLASEGHTLADQIAVMRHLASQGRRPRAVILELTLYNALGRYDGIAELLSRPLSPARAPAAGGASETGRARFLRQLHDAFGQIAEVDFIGIKARLVNNSATYVYAKVLINEAPVLRDLALRLGLRADAALAVPMPVTMLEPSGSADDDMIASTAQAVGALERWVSERLGVPFGVVLIPSPQQRNAAWLERYARSQGRRPEDLDPGRPYRLLRDQLRRRGVNVLDLIGTLGEADPPLNFPDDGHLTARGHELLASAIAHWLARDLDLRPDGR
jgi:hypothetical protein